MVLPAPHDAEANESRGRIRIAGMPLSAIAFLILTASIALLWSHYQLLWSDELCAILTGSISSLGRLIHIELTAPISFDPIGYNALIHGVIYLFGASALALRLPSMCGYLLMQVCLFYFVRRIATERAATFALAFPAVVGISFYSVQGRPYGLLLGLSALAMLSWQTATRRNSQRTGVLVVLSLSLALIVNTQYYGVLIFVPLCAAEAIRILERRRLDTPVLVSIFVGMAGLFVAMPFARALSSFSENHINHKGVSFHFIIHSYVWILVGYANWSLFAQRVIGFSVALLLLVLIAGFAHFHSRITLRLPHAEGTFLFILSAYPVFAYLLATFVTHFVETRYIQPALIGMTALLAILMTPILQNKRMGGIILAMLFVAIAVMGGLHIRSEKEQTDRTMASMVLSPKTQRILQAFPNQPIYTTDSSMFATIGHYSPNADLRSRITLVYATPNYHKEDVGADVTRQLGNMQADGVPSIVSYAAVSSHGEKEVFLLYHNPWDGTDRALSDAHADINYLGPAFGGDLVSVRFP